jgi:hypothetical protein
MLVATIQQPAVKYSLCRQVSVAMDLRITTLSIGSVSGTLKHIVQFFSVVFLLMWIVSFSSDGGRGGNITTKQLTNGYNILRPIGSKVWSHQPHGSFRHCRCTEETGWKFLTIRVENYKLRALRLCAVFLFVDTNETHRQFKHSKPTTGNKSQYVYRGERGGCRRQVRCGCSNLSPNGSRDPMVSKWL